MLHSFSSRSLLRSASLALIACLAVAAPALAGHEPARLGLTPIGESGEFFNISVEPGESRSLRVEIANFGHDELLARTYAADGYSIINGGFAADLFGAPASGTTRWLDYATQELTLAPGEGLVVDFSVSVPVGTAAGEYITALVAENVEPYRADDQGGLAMEQVNRTVVAVAIDVPGPRQASFEIGAVGHKAAGGISFVSFEVANTGKLHLKPAGRFTLRDAEGTEIGAAEPVMDSVYAGTETLVELPLAEVLTPGDYCAELSLADEATGAADATACLPFTVAAALAEPGAEGTPPSAIVQPVLDAVTHNPLPAGVVALGAMGILAGFYFFVRRRRRGPLGRTTPAWPRTDLRDARLSAVPKVAQGAAEAALLERIGRVREVRRAWLLRHDDYLELAVEAAPGTEVGAGSRMALALQASIGRSIGGVPLRVVFLGGRDIVARRTAGASPLYAVGDGPHAVEL
jgi:hypothetical protein